jgi:nicotinate-nucleotide adenylyltransferase
MSERRIGLLGGTFDPIHRGHTTLAAAAETALRLTRLHLVPARIPPHRPQPFASSYHRFAMVALAVAGHPAWRASDLELRSATPSYTTTTLGRFHQRGYDPTELFFLLGADAFADIIAWRDYPAILDRATFVVISRPGCPVDTLPALVPELAGRMVRHHPGSGLAARRPIVLLDAPTEDVSSTVIRRRRAEGLAIDGLVDPGVQRHIVQHGLYSSNVPGRRANDSVARPAAGRLHGQD